MVEDILKKNNEKETKKLLADGDENIIKSIDDVIAKIISSITPIKQVPPNQGGGVVGVAGVVGVVNESPTTPTTPQKPGGAGIDTKTPVLPPSVQESGNTEKPVLPPPTPESGGVVGVVDASPTTPTTPTTPGSLPGYTCDWATEYYEKHGRRHILRQILVCIKPTTQRVTADLDNIYVAREFDVKYVDGDVIFNSVEELREAIGKHPTDQVIYKTVQELEERLKPLEIKPIESIVKDVVYNEIAKDPLAWVKQKLQPLGDYRFKQAFAVVLSCISTFLPSDYRLHTVHSGLSKSGKSTTIRLASSLFPKVILQNQFGEIPHQIVGKGIVLYTGYVTPKALVYLKLNWSHKVLVIDQVDNPEDIAMLRVLMTNRLEVSPALTVQGESNKRTLNLEFKGDNPAIVFTTVLRNLNAKSNQTYNRVLLISYDTLPVIKELPSELVNDDERFAFLLWLKRTPTPKLPSVIEERINKTYGDMAMIIKAGVLALAKLRGHAEVTDDDVDMFATMYREDIIMSSYGIDLIDIKILNREKIDIMRDEYELRLRNLVKIQLLDPVPDDSGEQADISCVWSDGKIKFYKHTNKAHELLDQIAIVPAEVVKEALHDLQEMKCNEDMVKQYFAKKGYPGANVKAIMKSWGCTTGNIDGILAEIAKELSLPENAEVKCRDSAIAFKLKEKGLEPTRQRIETVKTLVGCAPDAIQTSRGIIQDPGFWRRYIENKFDHNVFATQQFAWEGASIDEIRKLLEMLAEAGIVEKIGEDEWRLR